MVCVGLCYLFANLAVVQLPPLEATEANGNAKG